ncbi:urea amidolyase associated protein UAAP1 [Xanthobacter autotrophicus DSM 431]|uniref:urea amidolyase associated protein UAAP1 n=1 Tax=Xanthobacter nonsaccharivorans TaxID=3119912 RepID=UPI003726D42D
MTVSEETRLFIEENRRRYEELKAAGQTHAPKALPGPTPRGSAPIPEGAVIRAETIPGGWYWSTPLKAGEALRIHLAQGPAAVSMIAWAAGDKSERLNYADTVKVQWTSALGKGRVLFSDMGRVMFSLIEDTTGMHDALVGGSTAASNRARYGEKVLRNTRDNFILTAGKLGLDKRDIPPALTFFAPVRTDEDGRFHWIDGQRQQGDFVDLRAEMDLIVALSNCPHPMDPTPDYAPPPVEAIRFKAPAPAADDLCRTATIEAVRGFENTAR